MYCSHCGNQIKNDSKFCPYCGGSLSSSDIGSAKKALKNTAVAVMDSAKAIGNSVNEATGEQAQKYAEKAKEMAKGFTDDIKQVTKDKDTSNFFANNKYRNVKILAVLLIAIIIPCSMFSGKSKGEKMAEDVVSATFSDCELKSVTKETGNDEGQIYVVKFIYSKGKGDESSAVVLITGDNATLIDVYPQSEYSRMEVFIDLLKEQLE